MSALHLSPSKLKRIIVFAKYMDKKNTKSVFPVMQDPKLLTRMHAFIPIIRSNCSGLIHTRIQCARFYCVHPFAVYVRGVWRRAAKPGKVLHREWVFVLQC